MKHGKILVKIVMMVTIFVICILVSTSRCIAKEKAESNEELRIAVTSKNFVINELKKVFAKKSGALDYEIYFKFAATEVERRHKYIYVFLSNSDPIVSRGDWIKSGKINHVAGHSVEEATFEILDVASSEIERYLASAEHQPSR